ncbi:MAG: YjiG family protein [Negativicoccus succinicivorans]|nr:YjiG family protein [Negativicoccus succinicivorans]
MNNTDTQSKNPFDVFVIGARKGWNIAVNNMIPNVLMAFAIAHILDLLGVLNFMSVIFGPVMGIFGLPGQAVMALLTAWLSLSAGVGMAVSLAGQGLLNSTHLTILLPAMVLMGSQLQYMGRLLAVADVKKKYWPLLMLTSILNAVIAMFIMRILA